LEEIYIMDNEELLRRIEALEEWKRQKEQQQISLPLDPVSLDVLAEYFPRITEEVVLTFSGASSHYLPILLGKQGDKNFSVTNQYIRYSANPATNEITITDRTISNKFANDEQVIFYVDFLTGDAAPAGITTNTTYYVIDESSDGYTFKISTSQDGSAVNITDAGTGKQFITKI
jgi:hypothetical protein